MLEQFKKGMKVIYVPHHAEGDTTHEDCRKGVVSSKNDTWVFVKFDCLACIMETGDEDYTAQACNPKDLVLR